MQRSIPPLILAARRNDTDAIHCLLTEGEDIESQDENGQTPLLAAITFGNVESVQALLKAGANQNVALNNGMRAERLAAEIGYVSIIKLLFDQNADVIAKDEDALLKKLLEKIAADNVKKKSTHRATIDVSEEIKKHALHYPKNIILVMLALGSDVLIDIIAPFKEFFLDPAKANDEFSIPLIHALMRYFIEFKPASFDKMNDRFSIRVIFDLILSWPVEIFKSRLASLYNQKITPNLLFAELSTIFNENNNIHALKNIYLGARRKILGEDRKQIAAGYEAHLIDLAGITITETISPLFLALLSLTIIINKIDLKTCVDDELDSIRNQLHAHHQTFELLLAILMVVKTTRPSLDNSDRVRRKFESIGPSLQNKLKQVEAILNQRKKCAAAEKLAKEKQEREKRKRDLVHAENIRRKQARIEEAAQLETEKQAKKTELEKLAAEKMIQQLEFARIEAEQKLRLAAEKKQKKQLKKEENKKRFSSVLKVNLSESVKNAFEHFDSDQPIYLVGSAAINAIIKSDAPLNDFDFAGTQNVQQLQENKHFWRSKYISGLYTHRQLQKIDFVQTETNFDISTDYLHRDFTICAVYINPEGYIVDPTERGYQDIRQRVLSMIDDPVSSLNHHPVRLLRALKYIVRGFKPDEKLHAALMDWDKNCDVTLDNLFFSKAEEFKNKFGESYLHQLEKYRQSHQPVNAVSPISIFQPAIPASDHAGLPICSKPF